jgi:hypothetical protein
MGLASAAAGRAATGFCALLSCAWLAGCDGAFGTSPPHAAPSNPSAEGADGQVELTWGAVTDATSYVILWDDNQTGPTYENEITDLEGTRYTHTGLTNLRVHHYKIVAETSGGRGPESRPVEAVPGPVPGPVEWVAVTSQAPGHTVYFAPAEGATHYRVYFAASEGLLAGRRPGALFAETDASPLVRDDVGVAVPVYYRVIAMNDSRIGVGGPVATSPTATITEHELEIAGVAFGLTDDDDDCLDLPTGTGGVSSDACVASYTARDLEDAGLEDLLADPRRVGDVRLADFNGDGLDDLFSNTDSSANLDGSVALLHLNQGDGVFQTSASVQALGIGGVGGTLLAADFDNDGDVDMFAPHDQTRGGTARNWFLVNDGAGVFTDRAAAAGLQTDPAGAAYVPNGGQAIDFDEDGYVDLLFGSRLMLNNGDGTFRDGGAAANLPVLADQGLRLFDLDLDGDFDLVHHSGVESRVFRNAGGVFDGGELVGTEPGDAYGSGLAVCDFNGDGFEDVTVARNLSATNRGTPKRLVNVNGSLLLSATQEAFGTDEDGLVARNERLACGDQNADGMADVLARWGESYRLMRGAVTLSRHIVLRVVDGDGRRNQQGRVVRVAPVDFPDRIMARVVDSGSGLRSQGQYDLLIGAPWPGDYEVTVRFADGEVTTTVEAGDGKIIFADGRVEDIDPEP